MVRESAAAIERWFFYQDVANLWKWARIDVFGTVLGYSGASFASRGECVDDARRSGYSEAAGLEPVRAARPTQRVSRFHGSPPSRV